MIERSGSTQRNAKKSLAPEFLLTVADVAQFPGLFHGDFLKGHREPRIALVGRSNVGKSSLINALLGARLARVSNQPGKTRALHFYHWKEYGKILADLPGYGYAKVAKTERERWAEFISLYFDHDPALERALVLLDARHGPSEADQEAIRFLSSESVPINFIFTKVDALKNQAERFARRREGDQALREWGAEPENVFWVSALKRDAGFRALCQTLQGLALKVKPPGAPLNLKAE